MRKTVCKKLRARAVMIAPETKTNIKTTIKRYFTGKTDVKGNKEIKAFQKKTVVFTGNQRIYQGLKNAYRIARRNGACSSVGGFLARIPSTGGAA